MTKERPGEREAVALKAVRERGVMATPLWIVNRNGGPSFCDPSDHPEWGPEERAAKIIDGETWVAVPIRDITALLAASSPEPRGEVGACCTDATGAPTEHHAGCPNGEEPLPPSIQAPFLRVMDSVYDLADDYGHPVNEWLQDLRRAILAALRAALRDGAGGAR